MPYQIKKTEIFINFHGYKNSSSFTHLTVITPSQLLVTGSWVEHIHAHKNVSSCQITALLAPTLVKQACIRHLFA